MALRGQLVGDAPNHLARGGKQVVLIHWSERPTICTPEAFEFISRRPLPLGTGRPKLYAKSSFEIAIKTTPCPIWRAYERCVPVAVPIIKEADLRMKGSIALDSEEEYLCAKVQESLKCFRRSSAEVQSNYRFNASSSADEFAKGLRQESKAGAAAKGHKDAKSRVRLVKEQIFKLVRDRVAARELIDHGYVHRNGIRRGPCESFPTPAERPRRQESVWYSASGMLSLAHACSNISSGISEGRMESTVPANTELSGGTSKV